MKNSFLDILKSCSVSEDMLIGIVPHSQIAAFKRRDRLKTLAVRSCADCPAVLPSKQAFEDRSYPINVPVYMYYNSKANDERIMKFVNFCTAGAK